MKFHLRGLALAILSLALFGAAFTVAGSDDNTANLRDSHPRLLSAISEPVSLVLLATGLGLSARRLRRR